MMASWLSYDDLLDLLQRSLLTPDVGHTVVYGMSDNTVTWWDNRFASKLGFVARDSSEPFRAKIDAQPAPEPGSAVAVLQGGAFATTGPFE